MWCNITIRLLQYINVDCGRIHINRNGDIILSEIFMRAAIFNICALFRWYSALHYAAVKILWRDRICYNYYESYWQHLPKSVAPDHGVLGPWGVQKSSKASITGDGQIIFQACHLSEPMPVQCGSVTTRPAFYNIFKSIPGYYWSVHL